MQARLNSPSSTVLGGIGLAVAVTLAMTAAPAKARPSHHHFASAHHRAVDGAVPYRAVSRQLRRDRSARASAAPDTYASSIHFGGGGADIVSEARRWLGGNPTSRRSLWCATFMNFVLQRTGHTGTGSDLAASFASYGHRVSGPQVGAIAVMSRKGGGHVGVVSGMDSSGHPIIISGNNGNRVRETAYAGGRIYAYVMPN
jgi:uncharacterized protein (TIGR02594 family)